MSIVISSIEPQSSAEQLNIPLGSLLISVNGHAINDVLDYGFHTAATHLRLEIQDKNSAEIKVYELFKGQYDRLGIESESFLMDTQHTCRNSCVFCFIDQLPKGLRESLYFKDDDERLSFLFGNYITLTNLGDREVQRIIEMKVSPINISIHTTNEKLRCEMMGNRFAGEKLKYLYQLAQAGLEINCQIVLCRGLNDGEELRKTLGNLTALYPSVQSIACVPVGLTEHREGLAKLEAFDRQSACEVLDIMGDINADCKQKYGVNLAYPADEFFLLAGRRIPPIEYYDELLQTENGVGMLAVLADDFSYALDEAVEDRDEHTCTIATGEAAYETILGLTEKAKQKIPRLRCEVVAIKNNFFGGNVVVSGLVTATDIISQLGGKTIKGDTLLIPENMLRREGDMFLDSITVEQLSRKLNKKIRIVSDGADLIEALRER
ncbi:MAG: DUF512 domain-containing protein [Oscillospiraceae bacterium]